MTESFVIRRTLADGTRVYVRTIPFYHEASLRADVCTTRGVNHATRWFVDISAQRFLNALAERRPFWKTARVIKVRAK